MTSANGITGQLIYTATGKYMFRVYDDKHGFVDYDLYHADLTITINDDDAYFYDGDFNKYLDHAPETLGHNHE
jgi:hypothetical protein